jgi:hypothetical protein
VVSVVEDKNILVSDSLQETLWRLEEVHQGFRKKSDVHVEEALEWVLSRQGLKGSYCNLFLPTSQDLTQGAQLLTGEHIKTNAATRHILGEEALRTIIVWNLEPSKPVKKATEGFSQIIERGGKSGSYCCYNCTIAFLRTLAVTKVDARDEILEKGLSKIKKAQSSDGRWHGFPFYYTLLFLSELDSPHAKNELKHAKKTAEGLLKRYSGNDRVSLFRRSALRAALNAI